MLGVLFDGDAAAQGDGMPSGGGYFVHHLLAGCLVRIHDADAGAFGGEFECNAVADASCGAGDKRRFVLESAHAVLAKDLCSTY